MTEHVDTNTIHGAPLPVLLDRTVPDKIIAERLALLANGYKPVPVAGKIPEGVGKWPTVCLDASEDKVRTWISQYPENTNTGALTGTIVTPDIDLLEVGVAKEVFAAAETILGVTPLQRVGKAPKILLCYRSETPIRKRQTGEFYLPYSPGVAQKVEVLGKGQQFVVFGTHPDTRQPYRWLGPSPLDIPASALPLVTDEQIDRFVAEAERIIRAAGGRTQRELDAERKPEGKTAAQPANASTPQKPLSISQQALQTVKPPSTLEFISKRPYAEVALREEADHLASLRNGRNNRLNTSAMKMGQLAARGLLTEDEVRAALLRSMAANGYIDEPDHGLAKAEATFASGWKKGLTEPREIKDRESSPSNPTPRTNAEPKVYTYKRLAEFEDENHDKREIIRGLIAYEETGSLIAPPKMCKSAVGAELAVHMAGGLNYHGFKNLGAVGVVYFAMERQMLTKRRIIAHRRLLGLPKDIPLIVCADLIDLTSPGSDRVVIETLNAMSKDLGVTVGAGIFDTRAKLIAGAGGDENLAKDRGVINANMQRVRNETGIYSLFIGHTGKDPGRGERGSNAGLGDDDVQMTITKLGDIFNVEVTAANDMDEGHLFSFRSEPYVFGQRDDGTTDQVYIVGAAPERSQKAASQEVRLTKNQQTLFSILYAAGSQGLTLEEWNERAHSAGLGTKRRADLFDWRSSLQSKGLVREYGGKWRVNHSS
jgi:AAA domain/Bifunctional DNA primase/polymerase, N-terminal